MNEERKIAYINKSGLVITFVFLGLTIFFQTKLSDSLLYYINSNNAFWNKYFDLIFYFVFFVIFICKYMKRIPYIFNDITKNYEKYLKYMFIMFLVIVFFMVTCAISLSYIGIGESNNQEMINLALKENKIVMFLVACIVGPIVEEIVFRCHLYKFLIGNRTSRVNTFIAIILTSALFALYHCDIKSIIGLDYNQILSVLPLFIMGLGLSYLHIKSTNILCPMIVHIMINIIALQS